MTTGNEPPAPQAAANSAAVVDEAPDRAENLVIGALTSQADLDKLRITNIVAVPTAILNRLTDWNGLTTKEEERERRADEEARVAALYREWNEELDENERHYAQLLNELSERRDQIGKHIEILKGNAIRMPDGRRAYPTADGGFVYIDDDGGETALKGKEAEEARRRYEANGCTNTKAEELEKDIKGQAALDSKITEIQRKETENKAVKNSLAQGTGNPGADGAAASRAMQDRLDEESSARDLLKSTKATVAASQANAVQSANTTADDFFSMSGSHGSEIQTNDQQARTNRTSYASQVAPSAALSSKGDFTVASTAASTAAASQSSAPPGPEVQKKPSSSPPIPAPA